LPINHTQQNKAAALLSIASNTVLVIAKLAIGSFSGSVSILSEAVHSGIDLVAAVIAWLSIREAAKPADNQHPYGHGKIENASGTIEALLIFAAAIYIIWSAMRKLSSGTMEIEGLGLGVFVMGASAGVNYLVSRHLLQVATKTDSIALRADAMHLRTDVYTSLGVLAGLATIKITGITLLDPLVAIGVAILIIKAAYQLTMKAFSPILDVKLPDDEEFIIRAVLAEHSEKFLEYHKLRTRKAGHVRHIDLHLVVPKSMRVDMAHTLSHTITAEFSNRLESCNTLVHIEPCQRGCDGCMVKCSDIRPNIYD